MRWTVEAETAPQRLDLWLLGRFPDQSRARLQQWIKDGCVTVNGRTARPSAMLRGREVVEVTPPRPAAMRAEPEDIPLVVLAETADYVVIDKPAGLAVHAGAGRRSGTLVNALLNRYGTLSSGGDPMRPGIVHRLDQWTSGVMVVARNDEAHRHLVAQFASRRTDKVYLTLVQGAIVGSSGLIDKPITRDPVRRTRMTAKLEFGRSAYTEWKVLQRCREFTLIEVRIRTGRTHQIRVHMASLGHPVAGDRLYGASGRVRGQPENGRYFLHAHRLSFDAPADGPRVTFESPLHPDLVQWLAAAECPGNL